MLEVLLTVVTYSFVPLLVVFSFWCLGYLCPGIGSLVLGGVWAVGLGVQGLGFRGQNFGEHCLGVPCSAMQAAKGFKVHGSGFSALQSVLMMR